MHRLRRKGGQTHGDVFGSFRSRRTISNPFPAMGHDRLPGLDMNGSSLGFHMQHPAEHQRIFVELRRLPRFHPTGWTLHPSHAQLSRVRIDQADEFVDEFGFVPGSIHPCGTFNQSRYIGSYSLPIPGSLRAEILSIDAAYGVYTNPKIIAVEQLRDPLAPCGERQGTFLLSLEGEEAG